MVRIPSPHHDDLDDKQPVVRHQSATLVKADGDEEPMARRRGKRPRHVALWSTMPKTSKREKRDHKLLDMKRCVVPGTNFRSLAQEACYY